MSLSGQFRYGISGFFQVSWVFWLFFLVVFSCGLVFGALAVDTVPAAVQANMSSYLQNFLSVAPSQLGTPVQIRLVLWDYVKYAGMIWLLGLTVVGAPLAVVWVFMRGFALGFTVAFLVADLGWRGLLIGIFGVLPQNLLAVPALVGLAVVAVDFAVVMVRSLASGRVPPLGQEMLTFSFFALVMGGLLLGASLVETYITPVFLHLVLPG